METWFRYSYLLVTSQKEIKDFLKETMMKVSALICSIFSWNIHRNIYIIKYIVLSYYVNSI